MVRAKFECTNVSRGVDSSSITLCPVVGGSKENAEFYRWTPGGSISIEIVRHETAQHFVPGKQYYVDFTEVKEA